jgi:2,4-dienoyl-CoA reductase-like NADH-dependent reductase (Old Yellow Enzyme family)
VQAGRRAAEAGFDAVQIHAAHGWFVSAFLSPVTNHRCDEFGGSATKRAAFLVKSIEGLRQSLGPEYPLLIKLGLKDYHPEGKSLDEGLQTAQAAITAGVDAIEISEGVEEVPFHHIRLKAIKPYYLEECRQARQAISRPTIVVGGMRRLSDIQAVVDGGMADAVSMCRPFIMDQHIVKKLREGSLSASKCSSCNNCLPLMRQGSLRCIHNKALINY